MASVKDSLSSGSGGFKTTFYSGVLQINAGATGTLFTLTPPANKKVRLTGLVAAGALSATITVNANSTSVVTAKTLATGSTVGLNSFVIGESLATTAGSGAGAIAFIESTTPITVIASAAIASGINYSYAYGD